MRCGPVRMSQEAESVTGIFDEVTGPCLSGVGVQKGVPLRKRGLMGSQCVLVLRDARHGGQVCVGPEQSRRRLRECYIRVTTKVGRTRRLY